MVRDHEDHDLLPLAEALLDERAYPHEVSSLQLIETHLSWVFLTGNYAYKVKKPVRFDFVDFSTLELRRHFCAEEVRCNRAFAPELYLGVVAIVLGADGRPEVSLDMDLPGQQVTEYAVRMREFDGTLQADRLLERNELGVEEMRQFGCRLASQHADLPVAAGGYNPGAAILDNFATLRNTLEHAEFDHLLARLEQRARDGLDRFADLLAERRQRHFVRECHGDLHLSNLARLDGALTAFDCLEFDESLRNIDCWSDCAFLFMDCCVRDREDLAYAFVDGYLNVSGDFEGVSLLSMFADYRSVVRAKIAALRFVQTGALHDRERTEKHLHWPLRRKQHAPGRLWVTCGLSGSGKSYWAARLIPLLPAIRLRSDVLRKRQHGLMPGQSSDSTVAGGLYQAQRSTAVYAELARHASKLLEQGENVIVDAACLQLAQREVLYQAANSVGAKVHLLYCTAPERVLRDRIAQRRAAGIDPSEADEQVLDWQKDYFDTPSDAEPVVMIDTTAVSLPELLELIR